VVSFCKSGANNFNCGASPTAVEKKFHVFCLSELTFFPKAPGPCRCTVPLITDEWQAD
jgi:hypothetical protein